MYAMNVFRSIFLLLLLQSWYAHSQTSLFASGKWIRIGVTETGIYGIDEAFLKRSGIATQTVNPGHIRLFGTPPGVLPQSNRTESYRELRELAVLCTDTDGKFDRNDRIFFYGQGPHVILPDSSGRFFSHEIHPYSDTTFYYLTYTAGVSQKIAVSNFPDTGGTVLDEFDEYYYYEADLRNLLGSGRTWLGEFIDSEASFQVNIEGLNKEKILTIQSSVIGTNRNDSQLDILIDNKTTATHPLVRSLYVPTDLYARYNRIGNRSDQQFTSLAASESFRLGYRFRSAPVSGTGAYLDYFSVQAKRKLKVYNRQTAARILKPAGATGSFRFRIADLPSGVMIWDTDHPFTPVSVPLLAGQQTFDYVSSFSGSVKNLILCPADKAFTPSFSGQVSVQDIRSHETPELLIVFPERFRAEALRLAEFREQNDKLKVLALSTSEIYNEFSGGSPDPTAIRNLCRYFYEKEPDTFRYLLLMGDGSYDYKNISSFPFTDMADGIPTYQSRESLEPVYSYASDDYFGFLEAHEGEWKEGYSENNFWYKSRDNDHTLDIGIGRLPVKSVAEAKAVTDKLIYYATLAKSPGKWKNRISLVADDKDYNIHQRDAEGLSAIIGEKHPSILVQKLYLDAFPQTSTPNGARSPQATEALVRTVEDGAFIVNYNGHGSEDGWTEEKLLTISEITRWRNIRNMPLFFTATCQFGKFDNPAQVSGAELALLNPSGGAIGLLTTTRPVYSSTNYRINTAFYEFLFSSPKGRIGDVFRLTKNAAMDGEINRNFTFLGDPSLLIPDFTSKVKITAINGRDPEQQVLKALSRVKIEGELENKNFQGTLNLGLFDKPVKLSTLGLSSESPRMDYETLKSRLFEGRSEIVNGKFSVSLVIPKDIDYRTGQGKIFMYAISRDSTQEYFGDFADFLIGGSEEGITDTTPPSVELEVRNNTLYARLTDENGINTSSSGIGHELLIILNDTLRIVAGNYFYHDRDHTSGMLIYPLGPLPAGRHKVEVIVWDTHNNKGGGTFVFNIERPGLKIEQLKNFPNPFRDFTTFSFRHNRTDDDLEIDLQIMNGTGQMIFRQQYLCYLCETEKQIGVTFPPQASQGGLLFYKIGVKSLTENLYGFGAGRLFFWK